MSPLRMLLPALMLGTAAVSAQDLLPQVERETAKVVPAMTEIRHQLHQNPELSNREEKTAALIAGYLRKLGLEVQTGVAKHGVVAILKGGRPGPVVAVRADIDALPVTEEAILPFASKVRTTYLGQEVGVMHACGHDIHTAVQLGVAAVLTGMKAELPGTVKFIFQPAEEGAPTGETGGAELMLKEGAFENPKVDAVFGLHVFPFETGKIVYRSGGLMASSDGFRVVIRGRQTHGALPWNGIDPITISAQIIGNIQSIVSRQTDLTLTPAILTVGYIRGGVRINIIPDSVEFGGTIRTFDEPTRDSIHARFRRIVSGMAIANGATATIELTHGTPVTYNDPALTEQMVPSLRRALGDANVELGRQTTTSEDFSLFQKQVPGLFVFLGVTPKGTDPAKIAPHPSPRFFADEAALVPGMKALSALAMDYLAMHASKTKM